MTQRDIEMCFAAETLMSAMFKDATGHSKRENQLVGESRTFRVAVAKHRKTLSANQCPLMLGWHDGEPL